MYAVVFEKGVWMTCMGYPIFPPERFKGGRLFRSIFCEQILGKQTVCEGLIRALSLCNYGVYRVSCSCREKCGKRLSVGLLYNVHRELVNGAEADWRGSFGTIIQIAC